MALGSHAPPMTRGSVIRIMGGAYLPPRQDPLAVAL
jgi:hypothetical protein